jgi:S-(hydroxymethyl)glutathione dehydrogenase / alcohol dehydrogenase
MTALGKELEFRDDVTTAGPGPDEVRVAIRAIGLCHTDASAWEGMFGAATPKILGHEAAGEVIEVGTAVDTLAVGDHVAVMGVAPCRRCAACISGQFTRCAAHAARKRAARFRVGDDVVPGHSGIGTFVGELVNPAAGFAKVDPDVPLDVAALMSCGVLTGVAAVLNTAQVQPGATVAVIGCGGVGVAAIQAARIAGATAIVGIDPFEAKRVTAMRFGATSAITPDEFSGVATGLSPGGFDFVFDVVANPGTIRAAWNATRGGGTVVIVGAGRADATVSFNPRELMSENKRLLGAVVTNVDPQRGIDALVGYWRAGLLDVEGMISKRMPFEEINEGMRLLRDGSGDIVRQVVTVG